LPHLAPCLFVKTESAKQPHGFGKSQARIYNASPLGAAAVLIKTADEAGKGVGFSTQCRRKPAGSR